MDEKRSTIVVEGLGDTNGVQPVKVNYPGNSHKTKDTRQTVPREDIQKVIKGNVIQKKESVGKKFRESLFGGTLVAAGHYIVYDVLIPALQALVVDSIRGGSERLIYGEKVDQRIRRDGNKSFVNYGGYSSSQGVVRRSTQPSQELNRAVRHNFETSIFEFKNDAEDVLSKLVGIIDQYNFASVGDLNSLIGVTGEFTDQKWGWQNLSSASVSRVREGYILNLPKPIPLD